MRNSVDGFAGHAPGNTTAFGWAGRPAGVTLGELIKRGEHLHASIPVLRLWANSPAVKLPGAQYSPPRGESGKVIFHRDGAYYLDDGAKSAGEGHLFQGEAELADAIARARAGDAEAWGDLYRQYAAAIFRFCRRALPTHEDAEDATVEIFMKLREKLGQYDPERPFSSWLYKVAANHCWDMLRRRHTRQDLETERRREVAAGVFRSRAAFAADRGADCRRAARRSGAIAAASAHGSDAALLRRLQLRRNCRNAALAPRSGGHHALAGASSIAPRT